LPPEHGGRTMALVPFVDAPEHWLKRAERVRIMATQADDPVSRTMLLRVAENLEQFAEHEYDRLQAQKQER
jgi:hypothetical protein